MSRPISPISNTPYYRATIIKVYIIIKTQKRRRTIVVDNSDLGNANGSENSLFF